MWEELRTLTDGRACLTLGIEAVPVTFFKRCLSKDVSSKRTNNI